MKLIVTQSRFNIDKCVDVRPARMSVPRSAYVPSPTRPLDKKDLPLFFAVSH